MNWKNWPYWVKGMSLGIILALFVYITEEQGLWGYTWRSQHPYASSVHGVIATIPTLLALTLNPLFCQPVEMEQGGTTSCFESFNLIYALLLLLEVVFVSVFLGYLYGKFKNRRNML